MKPQVERIYQAWELPPKDYLEELHVRRRRIGQRKMDWGREVQHFAGVTVQAVLDFERDCLRLTTCH